MNAAVVVPTNRPDSIAEWLRRWNRFDGAARVYVVEDGPAKAAECGEAPMFNVPENITHVCWADMDADLGDHAWIIPRRTDCVRSYGYLLAYRDGAEFIITLDDDCYPVEGMTPGRFVEAHVARLSSSVESDAWVTTTAPTIPRGVPYLERQRSRPCWLSHGLWRNVPDLDAVTALGAIRSEPDAGLVDRPIPAGRYFPMCGMNLAWRRELTPAMWFGLQGQPAWPYDRMGDIWCGLFVKRLADHLGLGVRSGEPHVWHDRASNVWANLRKEAPGMEANETLWQRIDAVRLRGSTVAECYHELADGLRLDGDYWEALRKGMHLWSDLFRVD